MEPSKFLYLDKVRKAGVKTPETLFLSFEDLISDDLKNLLNNFIDHNKSSFYIIRSCVEGEDGGVKSFAGHFESSPKVEGEKVLETVKIYFEKNKKIQKKICPQGKTHLMLQTFIEADCGGVLFSEWKYFNNHFVGEVGVGGAQNAVEGRKSFFFLCSKNEKDSEVLGVENLPVQSLKQILGACEVLFDFPLDIEWTSNQDEVTILQVRPITRGLQALRAANEAEIKVEKKFLEKTVKGNWYMNDFSESFGMLSPLSFEIIKYCFENSLETFKKLGFNAERFNFLARSRNGQIYANLEAQKNFFKPKSFITPFSQVVGEPKFLKKITNFAENFSDEKNFNLETLQTIFGYWNIANFYAQQKNKNDMTACSQVGEYELSILQNIEVPIQKRKMSWPDWRNFYKHLWVFELNKLKKEIQKNPLLVFSDFQELGPFPLSSSRRRGSSSVGTELTQEYKKDLTKKYQQDLKFSIIDFPSSFTEIENINFQKVTVVKGSIEGKEIFVVKNPKTFTGIFPKNVVLVAPYFENSWILEIDKFAGIILEQGGILSHSAIVAREKNIPYFIKWEEAVEEFLER